MKSHERWPDNRLDAICDTIASRREELGLTVYAVSQAAGVSQQAIGYYERKLRRPSVECLAKVARALQWKLSELVAAAESRL